MEHMDARIIGILRTKPGTSIENSVRAILTAFDEGLEALEITSNSDSWKIVIRECIKRRINIGVGSIKNGHIAKEAINLGAKFLVSPGLFLDSIAVAKEYKTPIIPGVYAKHEVEVVRDLNITHQKFFPASVQTHEELFRAISEPFRDEVQELKNKGWNIIVYGSPEYKKINPKSFVIVSTPTEFYKEYMLIKDKNPYCNIVVKLPEGKAGFERLKEVAEHSYKLEIKTYAVGGINDKNINDVLTRFGAHGVCPGKGLFDPEAIYKGDFDKVRRDVAKYVAIVHEFDLAWSTYVR